MRGATPWNRPDADKAISARRRRICASESGRAEVSISSSRLTRSGARRMMAKAA